MAVLPNFGNYNKPSKDSFSDPSAGYNILKIAPTSFFADYGCHVRILEETRILQKLGNRVVICTYHTGRDIPGLEIYRALNTPWNKTVQVGSNIHKIYYDALLSLKSLLVGLRVRPDIIHAHLHEGALIGSVLSRLLRIPLVFDFQGSLTSEMLDHSFITQESLAFRPLRALERIINNRANVIITSSQNAAEVLVREFGCPAGKVFTITDSVNPSFFRPRWQMEDPWTLMSLREKLGIPQGRRIIVYLGLLAEYQGTTNLLQAAKYLVEKNLPVHFLIMGYPGEEYYRAVAREMGLEEYTTFTGRIRYEEAPRYLALGDVATSPKISETEGNGKLLNYMSVGLPTVTFDTPVAREILGELGVYARLGDHESLARGIEYLLDNNVGMVELGRRLRERAEQRYSWDSAGGLLMSIYDAVSGRVRVYHGDYPSLRKTANAHRPLSRVR